MPLKPSSNKFKIYQDPVCAYVSKENRQQAPYKLHISINLDTYLENENNVKDKLKKLLEEALNDGTIVSFKYFRSDNLEEMEKMGYSFASIRRFLEGDQYTLYLPCQWIQDQNKLLELVYAIEQQLINVKAGNFTESESIVSKHISFRRSELTIPDFFEMSDNFKKDFSLLKEIKRITIEENIEDILDDSGTPCKFYLHALLPDQIPKDPTYSKQDFISYMKEKFQDQHPLYLYLINHFDPKFLSVKTKYGLDRQQVLAWSSLEFQVWLLQGVQLVKNKEITNDIFLKIASYVGSLSLPKTDDVFTKMTFHTYQPLLINHLEQYSKKFFIKHKERAKSFKIACEGAKSRTELISLLHYQDTLFNPNNNNNKENDLLKHEQSLKNQNKDAYYDIIKRFSQRF